MCGVLWCEMCVVHVVCLVRVVVWCIVVCLACAASCVACGAVCDVPPIFFFFFISLCLSCHSETVALNVAPARPAHRKRTYVGLRILGSLGTNFSFFDQCRHIGTNSSKLPPSSRVTRIPLAAAMAVVAVSLFSGRRTLLHAVVCIDFIGNLGNCSGFLVMTFW